ncbi:MAG: mannose-1-phosphate guanylyltransferase [Spirochaetes bacterium]|nr:mannose-1-phosphate guanylyltransferase [Spirochaetota bacterium]
MEAILILAGGSGTRLWPASSSYHPKQFLSFGLERSFLQNTVERGLSVNPQAEVVIVTAEMYREETIAQVSYYLDRGARITVLGEPMGRNTAPAIFLGALYLKHRIPREGRILILSADHLISPVESFVKDVRKADSLGASGWITVFGIPPSSPHTGYGYIERGEGEGGGYRVRAFKEKPDKDTAEKYLRSGRFYWNSGMFLFSLQTLFEEFDRYAPDIVKPFHEKGLLEGLSEQFFTHLRHVYEVLPSISVDYAILERSHRVAMVPATFSWNDVGSWDEVAQLLPGEAPRIIELEGKGNYVYSEIPVALCGVEDLIVVIKDGKALILKKGFSQLVRDVASRFNSV